MNDLIDRQKAIDAARDWYEGLICGSFKGLEKRLLALPSAQPDVLACGSGELVQESDSLVQDCISRQDAIDAIGIEYGIDASETLEGVPEVDAVEVVRCKDCMKYDSHGHRCKHWNHGVVVMDFCSRAERRTDA